jgi:flotillin
MAFSIIAFLGAGLPGWITFLIVLVILAGLVVAFAYQYRKVGPNEVLIISGGRGQTVRQPDGTVREVGYRTHLGGGTFVIPFMEKVQILSIEMINVEVKTPEVYTINGVPVKIEATAQVRINNDPEFIRMAAEQFLGTGPDGIRDITRQNLEGRVRAVLGTMTVEEVYQEQDAFAGKILASAQADLGRMGLVLAAVNLQGITDAMGYLEALGRPRIAQVKRDAIVAEAEAEKEAKMKTAIAKKEGDIARFKGETEIAEANKNFESQKAFFEVETNEARARADMAYDLQRHRMMQEIKKEEGKTKAIEKQQAIVLQEHEITRREKELDAEVKKQADADRYNAEAKAEAEAFKIKTEADARAEAARAEGAAEAEAMLKKAEAWREYSQAAMFDMLMKQLPELAAAVAEPLSKVDKITVVNTGGDDSKLGLSKVTGEVTNVLAQLPALVESLSGVDVKQLLNKLPQSGSRTETGTGAGSSDDARKVKAKAKAKSSKSPKRKK